MGDLFEYQNILEAVQHIAQDIADIKAKLCGQPAAPAVVGMQAEPALPKFKKVKGSRRWTERDESDLIAGVARGLDYDTIAAGLDRTAKAVENKVSKMRVSGRWPEKLASK